MVDKDDLFQEEDGTSPQDHDKDEPFPDEDDDIIDLLDTAEIPEEDIEEDIIELADMVEAPDDDILGLTEEAQASVADDDVLDLTEVVTDEDEPQDDILELTDIADKDDAQDDGVLDLTQKTDVTDVDDDIIDLTEAVAEDEAMDFLDTAAIPDRDMAEDSIEPADTAQEDDDDIIDLEEAVDEDEAMDFLDTVAMPARDMAKDILEPADTAQELDFATDDDSLDPTDAVVQDDVDEAAMDPTELDEPSEPDQEERFEKTIALPSPGYEEDKELLELIDDIQATLNDEPVDAYTGDQEDTPQADEAIDTDTLEDDADAYTFLGDDELIEGRDTPESETEFVDHLGIDLTSEIERKALEESREAVIEDVKPAESMEPGLAPGALETAVKLALTEMLADENNPLAKAIENAVRKALGHGENT